MLKTLNPFLTLGEKLGSMQAQLSYEIPKELRITYVGDLNDLPHEPVGIAVIKGFCSRISDTEVNYVNARLVADQHGLNILEISKRHPSEYTNSLTVAVKYPNGEERSLTGVKFAEGDIRLTRYNEKVINIEPEGNMLIIRNKDVPGVVGVIGTLLGEAGVNIANLRLARSKEAGSAMTIVTTDQVVDDAARERLQAQENIISVKFVQL
ncbi:MAG: ACT domain-containing protein [Deltaproteobacteria bacterium]|nr:ACT domain-containing protein [Deltaproteobacteria bacterium]